MHATHARDRVRAVVCLCECGWGAWQRCRLPGCALRPEDMLGADRRPLQPRQRRSGERCAASSHGATMRVTRARDRIPVPSCARATVGEALAL